jgi:hypothetical protein
MGKKTLKRHHKQKVYKMKGCSKRRRTRKYLGGNRIPDAALPAQEPPPTGATTATNMNLGQTGGTCSVCSANQPMMIGGKKKWGGCCGSCGTAMTGGGCGCDKLFGGKKSWKKQKGGNTWAPQGLIGRPWTPSPYGWPGVDGVAGDRNFLAYNSYKVDPQTAMVNVGPNPPFLGGKRRKGSRKQKGGQLSNFIGQDLVNLGRQIEYGFGSAYNGINGYAAPINPLPWKDQLTHSRAGSLSGALY